MSNRAAMVTACVVAFACVMLLGMCTSGHGEKAAVAPSPADTIVATAPVSSAPAAIPCREAPANLVTFINNSFAHPGEHLDHAQSVTGPGGVVYIGGNIVDAAGEKLASQETWVYTGDLFAALTLDARERTGMADGRHLPGIDGAWFEYNDAVGKCVGDVERAANQN